MLHQSSHPRQLKPLSSCKRISRLPPFPPLHNDLWKILVLKLQSINYLLVIIRSNCSIVTPGWKNIGKIRTAEDGSHRIVEKEEEEKEWVP